MSSSADLEAQDSGKSMRLIGVVNSGRRSMALLDVPGLSEQVLVGEGDLVSGYTLSTVMADRVDLIKGDETQSLSVRNLRWIKADPEDKVYTREYAGANMERRRNAREIASLEKIKADTNKKEVEIRPDFIRPMGGRITSPFGRRQAFKTSTGMYSSSHHEGIDIAAPHGTRVKAAADGVVTASGYALHRGRYVIIRHAGGYSTRYYHLYRRHVKRGQRVKAGDTIGLEGSTGNSTGPHLHFEIRKDNQPLDPARFIPSLKR
ncbi:MAG: M23 family metallopeptidase [Candidatus Sumerlaeota bacterium]